jgi:hypothetical protein
MDDLTFTNNNEIEARRQILSNDVVFLSQRVFVRRMHMHANKHQAKLEMALGKILIDLNKEYLYPVDIILLESSFDELEEMLEQLEHCN